MNGGSLVAEVLRAHGVPFLFTLCGGHISPILVECKARGIRVIDVRDEKNAVFAADAVGRLTGIPGVAAVTAGPGVTNAITAIKNAQLAQAPLIVLGGASATVLRGRGSLQDIDQMALITPHVKWAARPSTLRAVGPALERAFFEATSGVPGPVFVELAIDLLYDRSLVKEWYLVKADAGGGIADKALNTYLRLHLKNQFAFADRLSVPSPRAAEVPRHSERQVTRAAQLLTAAERPVMVLGSQVMLRPERVDELVKGIERLNVPVYLSGMARGLLGANHPLQLRHKRRNALRESDCVLLAGVPCDFRLDYGAHIRRTATFIGVNRSQVDLTKNRRPDLAVLADPHDFLTALSRAAPQPTRKGWHDTLAGRDTARNDEIAAMAEQPTELVNPLAVCQGIERHLADDSMIVVDGGDFVATASYVAQPRRPLSWLDPGVFGTLGVGAGFAMGAKLVRPAADVWLVYGDGSAGYSLQEIDTFVRHQLPIIAVVGNDAGWTQIARDQIANLGDDVGTTLLPNDYDKIAEAWGGKGIRVDDPSQVDAAMAQAVEWSHAGHPVVINARIGTTDFRKGSLSV